MIDSKFFIIVNMALFCNNRLHFIRFSLIFRIFVNICGQKIV